MSEIDEALAARDLASPFYRRIARWRDVPLSRPMPDRNNYVWLAAPTAQLASFDRPGDDDWVAMWTGGAGIRDLSSMSVEQVEVAAPVPAPVSEPIDPWDVW